MTTLTEHSHAPGVSPTDGHGGSSLHRFASFDVDAHRVPRGREEAWRFTPMVRLRGLHVDTALDGHDYEVEIDADPQVRVEIGDADDPRRGVSGYVPIDRVSARAWAAADRVLAVTVPNDVVTTRPTVVRQRGLSAEKAAAGHVVITAQAFSRSVVLIEYEGSAVFADNVEIVVEDGAQLTLVSLQDWADDTVHLSHHHVHVGREIRGREKSLGQYAVGGGRLEPRLRSPRERRPGNVG